MSLNSPLLGIDTNSGTSYGVRSVTSTLHVTTSNDPFVIEEDRFIKADDALSRIRILAQVLLKTHYG